MNTDSIRYGQGAQTIGTIAIDRLGVPRLLASATYPTYQIVDLRESEETERREVVASTAATLPAISTTLSAAAGLDQADPRRITVASAASLVVGRTYLLTDGASMVQDAVTIARIQGTEVELTREINRTFSSGAVLADLSILGTFPSDVANDSVRLDNGGGPFQVVWTYTIGDEVYVQPREIWLTRYGVAPWVTPDEVFLHLPGYEGVSGGKVTPEAAIRAATDEFAAEMQSGGAWERDPANFRGSMVAALYIRKRALVHMLRGSRDDGLVALAADFAAEAQAHLSNLLQGRPPARSVTIDPVLDTVVTPTVVGGYFARG